MPAHELTKQPWRLISLLNLWGTFESLVKSYASFKNCFLDIGCRELSSPIKCCPKAPPSLKKKYTLIFLTSAHPFPILLKPSWSELAARWNSKLLARTVPFTLISEWLISYPPPTIWPLQYFYPWSLAFWRRNNIQLVVHTFFYTFRCKILLHVSAIIRYNT